MSIEFEIDCDVPGSVFCLFVGLTARCFPNMSAVNLKEFKFIFLDALQAMLSHFSLFMSIYISFYLTFLLKELIALGALSLQNGL